MNKDFSPIVSVVVPVYNAEKYLSETLSDLLNQTLTNAEFIFVDDGSTDLSLSILQSAAEKDKRVRILQQNHKFAGCARNLGLEAAKGKYFIALDSDDRFELNLLELTVNRAEETNAEIIVFDADTLQDGKYIFKSNLAYVNNLPKEPFKPSSETFGAFGVTATWTKLYRMDFLRNGGFLYQETFESNDIRFTIHTMASAKCVVAIPKILVHYRIGLKDNIQSNKDAYSTDVIRAYSSLREYLIKDDLWEEFRKIYITRALVSLLFGRMFSFKNISIAYEWYNQLKNSYLKDLYLDNICQEDLVGPYSLKIWERYTFFVKSSFDEWLWFNLQEQINKNSKIEELKTKLKQKDVEILKLKQKQTKYNIKNIRNSCSYRLGLFLTFPFRVVANLFKKRN